MRSVAPVVAGWWPLVWLSVLTTVGMVVVWWISEEEGDDEEG